MDAQSIIGLFGSVQASAPSHLEIRKGHFRLDAAFYSAERENAEGALTRSRLEISRLDDLAEIHCSTMRERTFVGREYGIPFLTGSTLDTTSDDDLKYVSKVVTRNIGAEMLRTNDVLISSAGTVGKMDFVYSNHEGRLASQDIIRIRPSHGTLPAGYLFAFLTSPLAKQLIPEPSGSVIVRVYEEALENLPIPRVGKDLEERIGNLIVAAFRARARARQLLAESDADLLRVNGLPALAHFAAEPFDPLGQPETMQVKAKNVVASNGDGSEYRLDAHFYNRTAQDAVANIKKCRSEVKTVGAVAERVLMGPRFKRNYVESTHGVPFLSGKNIVQVRPTDLKYLSNLQMAEMQELVIKRGWTLITCSGTIGRTCFVWRNYEDYAASQHILRVIPNESAIDPGYLYAFLASRYGYEQILRYRHGSVIDEVTDKQIEHVLVPCPKRREQEAIGDKVREAYDKRAEAIRLEDEAQAILLNEITKAQKAKGA